jgi:hypothetical protein
MHTKLETVLGELKVCGHKKTAQACHVFCEHQVLILWEVHEILSLFMKHLNYFRFNNFCSYPKDLLNCIGKLFDFERNLLLLDRESVF